METLKMRYVFVQEVLGMMAGDKQLAESYQIAKHPDGMAADESKAHDDADESLEEGLQKASTFFPRTVDGQPMFWDYQVKGNLKNAVRMWHSQDRFETATLKKWRLTPYLYKRTVDNTMFVRPRQLPIIVPEGVDVTKLSFCERPLRAETRKGERIALARSEMLPAGCYIDVLIDVFNDDLVEVVRDMVEMGNLQGLGQWRNAGMGRFKAVYTESS